MGCFFVAAVPQLTRKGVAVAQQHTQLGVGWFRLKGISLRWDALSLVWNGNIICCTLLRVPVCFGYVRLSVSHRWNRLSHLGETVSLTVVRLTWKGRDARQEGLRMRDRVVVSERENLSAHL